MRTLFNTCALATLLACAVAAAAGGGTSQGTGSQQHLVGEVTAIDEAAGRITVRTDAGASRSVTTGERTVYRRVPPGETSLEKAELITGRDVRVGDRVLVPGGAAGGQTAAAQIIVMARGEAKAVRDRERDEWRRRGVAGRVVALDPSKKEIVIEARGREGVQVVTVAAAGDARFRRFAPDSLRTGDAVPGAFADIQVGEQLRALGDRSADGARVTAEEIVSGPVTRVIGTVVGTDAARGEVTVKRDQTGETTTVAVGKRTTLRRMPREVAEELARQSARREGQSERAAGGSSQPRDGGPRAEGAGRPGDGGGGARRGGRNLQQVFESLPTITVADLKKGDSVVVTGTGVADAAHVTAVALIAGEADMLRWLQRLQRAAPGLGNMSPGLPGAVMGGNTGSNDDDEP